MATFEESVIGWIARETGTPRERVSVASRVPDDFDVDEFETAELFDKFGAEFQVNMAALCDHWDLYFNPIGMPVTYPFYIPVAIGTVAYLMFPQALARIPVWADAIVIVAVIWWAWRKFYALHIKEKIPIHVQDLVDAAAAGKWTGQEAGSTGLR